ncbi:MAG: hypothetical protein FJZ38_10300 [Candidatus Rokubacteria bacterium]|nr:hypothetical protein [Candidatus Rokubacteria bacterium]
MNAAHHPRPEADDRDHGVVPPAALVRREPPRPVVQDRAGRLAVPRAVPRRGGRSHQRAGIRGPRHRDRRRQPVRSRRRRQVVVLLSDRAARRDRGPSRYLARLDVASWPASRQDPLGSAGGVSAGRREAASQSRPLEYAALWKVAQRLTDKPVKFGTICAPALASMLWDEYYKDDRALINDLSDIMNAELRELSAAGCPLIRVEEPPHHGRTTRPDCTDAELEFLTEAFNRQLVGVDAEIWVHTRWGNPNQQRVYWETPSYERALPYLLALDADVITFECASTDGRDLPLFAKHKTDKKIGIGVISHCNTVVEPPEHVARLIRKALEYIPPERLVVTTDCGFGREGLSRRIAYYKCVALVEGTNIVRRELGLPEARVRASDPRVYFAGEV